jgi:hypothetical protein
VCYHRVWLSSLAIISTGVRRLFEIAPDLPNVCKACGCVVSTKRKGFALPTSVEYGNTSSNCLVKELLQQKQPTHVFYCSPGWNACVSVCCNVNLLDMYKYNTTPYMQFCTHSIFSTSSKVYKTLVSIPSFCKLIYEKKCMCSCLKPSSLDKGKFTPTLFQK